MKQFRTFLLFAVIFIIVAAKIQQPATCPLICNCTQISDQCSICVEKQFYRFIAENKTCPCLPGYTENYPHTDFCCPKNCSSCYYQGCFQCRKNWTRILKRESYICTCKTYYEYDSQLDECICLANRYNLQNQFNQLNYYSPSRFQCYRCGIGCKCNASGCYSCVPDSNREIKLTTNNVWSCLCQNGYKEDQNGACVNLNLILNCTGNRILVNNKCVCTEPFYQSGGSCICKSNLNPASYYLYRGICYICPSLCKCNKFGCVHCSYYAKRNIYQNNCSCFQAKGIIQVDGQCFCISPYDSQCNCNSYNYPSIFFQNSISYECLKCPKGCICNKTACLSCDSSSRRNSSGYCISPLIQLDGQCIGCPNNFIYVNKSCICPTKFLQQENSYLLFYDQQTQTCNKCPVNCLCDRTGCIQCDQSLNRNITLNKYNIYTCYCDIKKFFYQNKSSVCQCIFPLTYDSTINNCKCQQPYFLDNNGKCRCKSYQNPILYYVSSNNQCKICPIQCNCSDIGCYECSSKTGRIIIKKSYFTQFFICPCFPIKSNQINGYCTQCQLNQYLWDGKCMNCDSNCLTCDENGCLSCLQPSMKLVNKKCYCWDMKIDNGSNCLCPKHNFLNIANGKCLPCPVYCQNCYLNLLLSGIIECIECNSSLFRKNDTENNCPCINYYKQGPITHAYCCHQSCKDCNISGCISCLPFTFRQLNNSDLNNITCSCKSGFIETYSTYCSCPKGLYLYNGQCFPCPIYCFECKMSILQVINCTICADGFNRKMTNLSEVVFGKIIYILDCICNQRYVLYANSSYCYPVGCIQISNNGICKKCDYNRTISYSGKNCNCSVGFYTDNYYNCLPCSFNCIQCISLDICITCNKSNNSYLIMNKKTLQIECIIPDGNKTILVQNRDKLILQFLNPYSSTQEMQIYLILFTEDVSINTIKLKVERFKNITIEYFMVEFNHLFQDQLHEFLLYINTSTNGYQGYFLVQNGMYLKQTLEYPYIQSIFISIFIACVMVTSLILHILGQKNNQLMYYCQTIYFVAMNVKDSHMYIVPLLNYFRITTFNFTFDDSGSPFNSLLVDWNLFIEHCDGNYKYFSMDNNLIRNAGLALYLNIQTIFFSIAFRIVYYLLYKSKYKPFVQKYKKLVYRSIEWMYKMTIYPLIFYSLSTIINYHKQYSLVNQQFRQLNFRLSILILIYYTIITVIQIAFQDISKIHRYDIVIQYIFNIINSIIIVCSVYTRLIFSLFLPMFLRNILQYIIFRSYIRKFSPLYNYITILNIVQCFVIVTIYFNHKISTVTLLLSYILGLIIMRILLIRMKHSHYKFEKKITKQLKAIQFTIQTNHITQSKLGDEPFSGTLNMVKMQ